MAEPSLSLPLNPLPAFPSAAENPLAGLASAIANYPLQQAQYATAEDNIFKANLPKLQFMAGIAGRDPQFASSPMFTRQADYLLRSSGLPGMTRPDGTIDLNALGAHAPLFDFLQQPNMLALLQATRPENRTPALFSALGYNDPGLPQVSQIIPYKGDLAPTEMVELEKLAGEAVLKMGDLGFENSVAFLNGVGKTLQDHGIMNIDALIAGLKPTLGLKIMAQIATLDSRQLLNYAQRKAILDELQPKIDHMKSIDDMNEIHAQLYSTMAQYYPELAGSLVQQRQATANAANARADVSRSSLAAMNFDGSKMNKKDLTNAVKQFKSEMDIANRAIPTLSGKVANDQILLSSLTAQGSTADPDALAKAQQAVQDDQQALNEAQISAKENTSAYRRATEALYGKGWIKPDDATSTGAVPGTNAGTNPTSSAAPPGPLGTKVVPFMTKDHKYLYSDTLGNIYFQDGTKMPGTHWDGDPTHPPTKTGGL